MPTAFIMWFLATVACWVGCASADTEAGQIAWGLASFFCCFMALCQGFNSRTRSASTEVATASTSQPEYVDQRTNKIIDRRQRYRIIDGVTVEYDNRGAVEIGKPPEAIAVMIAARPQVGFREEMTMLFKGASYRAPAIDRGQIKAIPHRQGEPMPIPTDQKQKVAR